MALALNPVTRASLPIVTASPVRVLLWGNPSAWCCALLCIAVETSFFLYEKYKPSHRWKVKGKKLRLLQFQGNERAWGVVDLVKVYMTRFFGALEVKEIAGKVDGLTG
jgi:hypothetical protein